jgi:hypothetical protein
MGNIVEFLARVGADADLRAASGDALRQALEDEAIDPALREAIIAGDATGLRLLLGQQVFFSSLMPDGGEEDVEDDDRQEDDDDDDKDDDAAAKRSPLPRG